MKLVKKIFPFLTAEVGMLVMRKPLLARGSYLKIIDVKTVMSV